MDLCAIFDICARMDAHEGQAAWAQAVFSVIAILASSLLAIWVPVRMADVEERRRVERALANMVMLIGVAYSVWSALEQIMTRREFNEHTPGTLQERIELGRAIADQIPTSMMLGTAFVHVTRCRLRLQTIELTLAALAEQSDPYLKATSIPFSDILEELDEDLEAVEKMRPRRMAGHWLLYAPGDK